jgi:hypothetical protein
MLKKSVNNKELFNEKDKIAWVADEPGTGDKYLALFNASDNIQLVSISLSKQLGLKTRCTIKNLWTGSKEKSSADLLTSTINPHGAVLYRLSKQK